MAKEEKQTVDRSRKVEELGLARKIMDVLSRKAEEISQSTKESSNKFHLEPAEREKLLEINNLGLMEGVAAGLLSLVVLRRIRASLMRRLWFKHQEAQQQAARPQAPPPSASQSTMGGHNNTNAFQNSSPFHKPQQPPNSPFTPPSSASSSSPSPPPLPLTQAASKPPPSFGSNGMPKQGTFTFLFGWFLDSLGAFSVMVTVSFMMTDLDKILNKLSTLPLVPGQSTISREFCPDVVRALQQLKQEGPDKRDILENAQTKQLQAVLLFAENCQRRASYERQLRVDKGVGQHFPVDVPETGVPPDYPIDAQGVVGQNDLHNNDDGSGEDDGDGFYNPHEQGTEEWANDFTTDRDDK